MADGSSPRARLEAILFVTALTAHFSRCWVVYLCQGILNGKSLPTKKSILVTLTVNQNLVRVTLTTKQSTSWIVGGEQLIIYCQQLT